MGKPEIQDGKVKVEDVLDILHMIRERVEPSVFARNPDKRQEEAAIALFDIDLVIEYLRNPSGEDDFGLR